MWVKINANFYLKIVYLKKFLKGIKKKMMNSTR